MSIVKRVINFIKRRQIYGVAKKHIKIMDTFESIDFIMQNRCCVARYGDGELRIAYDDNDLPFQKSSDDLSRSLRTIIEENKKPNKLLVCMPYPFISTRGYKSESKNFWIIYRNHYMENLFDAYKESGVSFYGDTQLSRPYIDRKDGREWASKVFPKLKSLWDGEDLLIVEGMESRLGVGNNLFSNAKSIRRIICPSKEAFEKYDDIYNAILKFAGNGLVLIALGPTATVLAADLSKKDIWAIDIGHVDIEYEWFLRNAKEKIKIEGKHVNEAKGGRIVAECNDEKYLSEIICKIS